MGYVREKYTRAYYLKQTEDGTPVPYGAEGIAEFGTGTVRPVDAKILENVDFRNARVIEFGFGRGEAAKYIIEHGAAYYEGIDFSAAAVEIAAEHLRHFGIPLPPLHHADALDFLRSYVPRHKTDNIAPFTIVNMLDFVEHVPREELREIFALLKEIVESLALFVIGTPAYPFDNEEDVEFDVRKAATTDRSDYIEETKGMHCNKYTLISLQQFMKECGFSCVSQDHFFTVQADSAGQLTSFRSYRQRWEAAVEEGVPLEKDWKQDYIEYGYKAPENLRWQQFEQGDLKNHRLYMTDWYYSLVFADGDYDKAMFNDVSGGDIAGKTVFDVGGFMGITALLFAQQVGPTGRVCVFEPNPWNQDRMALNFSENPKPAAIITGYPYAISDADGASEMVFSKNVDNGHSSTSRLVNSHPTLSDNAVLELGFQRIRIDTMRLDAFVQESGIIPDVIKVDIEGAENRFLLGAEKTIRTFHPLIYMEIHSPYCAISCWRLLERFGYEIDILLEEEDGRLFIKARAGAERPEAPAANSQQLRQTTLRDLSLEYIVRDESKRTAASLKQIAASLKQTVASLQNIEASSLDNKQRLDALPAAVQEIKASQIALVDHVNAAMSFRGMFLRACKIPPRLIRKTWRSGVFVLKHPIEAATNIFGDGKSPATRLGE